MGFMVRFPPKLVCRMQDARCRMQRYVMDVKAGAEVPIARLSALSEGASSAA